MLNNQDIVSREILKSLIEGEKRNRDIVKEVWGRVRKNMRISEPSLRVIVARRLKKIADDGLVDRIVVGHKNVKYAIKKELREKVEQLYVDAPILTMEQFLQVMRTLSLPEAKLKNILLLSSGILLIYEKTGNLEDCLADLEMLKTEVETTIELFSKELDRK